MNVKLCLMIMALAFLQACSSNNNIEKNLAELDEIYGECNNPYRQYTTIQKKICRDKAMAAGPDGEISEPLDFNELIDGLTNKSKTYVSASDTNSFLWDAALKVLNPYALKISDFDGGYIETNWIISSALPNERCLIKAHITSIELVSNGVNIRLICEQKINNEWYLSEKKLLNEERQLTLKILQEAQILSSITG